MSKGALKRNVNLPMCAQTRLRHSWNSVIAVVHDVGFAHSSDELLTAAARNQNAELNLYRGIQPPLWSVEVIGFSRHAFTAGLNDLVVILVQSSVLS